jgi:hypothetical protein
MVFSLASVTTAASASCETHNPDRWICTPKTTSRHDQTPGAIIAALLGLG